MVRPHENGIKDDGTKPGYGGMKPPERDVNTSGGPHEPPDGARQPGAKPSATAAHVLAAGLDVRPDGDLLHEILLADAAADETAVAGLHSGLDGDLLHGRLS